MTEDVPEAPEPERSEDGVDVTLIDWMLSLTPNERLDALEGMLELAASVREEDEHQ
jgi:hypothetical protein